MKRFLLALRARVSGFDGYLLLAALLIFVFGLAEVWSTDHALAAKQLPLAGLGLFGLIVLANVDYHHLRKVSPVILILSLILLVATLFLGKGIRGVSRWLPVGPLAFQPSEFAKLGFIFGLAWIFSEGRLSVALRFLLSILTFLVCCGLVVLQPNLGTALVFAPLWLGMALMAEVPLYYLLGLVAGGVGSLPLLWHFLRDYQRQRIFSFLNPRADPLGSGYNVLQAIVAVGSGQLWGRGLGRGPQSQLRFLPERSTDFIFASLAEEWGLFGATILLALYFILLLRIFKIARLATTRFGMLICVGVFLMVLAQVLVNIGMNLGIMPITGLPLPLVSAGGSSLIVTLLSLGVVESIAGHREDRPLA